MTKRTYAFAFYAIYLITAVWTNNTPTKAEKGMTKNKVTKSDNVEASVLMPKVLHYLNTKHDSKRHVTERVPNVKAQKYKNGQKTVKLVAKNITRKIETSNLNKTKKIGGKEKIFKGNFSNRLQKVRNETGKIRTVTTRVESEMIKNTTRESRNYDKVNISKRKRKTKKHFREGRRKKLKIERNKSKNKKLFTKKKKNVRQKKLSKKLSDTMSHVAYERTKFDDNDDEEENDEHKQYYMPYVFRIPPDSRITPDRVFYNEPFDNGYDDYYDENRKDVIPKPVIAPSRGYISNNGYNSERGEKRSAYAPVVSAVQNLDRSETELFDSLFSPDHENKDVTLEMNNELSNFAKIPSDLEVFNPTDNQNQLYFDRDSNADAMREYMQNPYQAMKTTQKPTQDELDTSDIVDNEEKLLSLVQKVIQKHKKEKEKLKANNKMTTTVRMGDTSEVFDTSNSKGNQKPNTLEDFLRKQPTWKMKTLKNTAQVPTRDMKKPFDKASNNIGNGVSVKNSQAHGNVNKNNNDRELNGRTKSMSSQKKPAATFLTNSNGQHVIVEDWNAKSKDSSKIRTMGSSQKIRAHSLSGSVTSHSSYPVLIETSTKQSWRKTMNRPAPVKNVPGMRKNSLSEAPTITGDEARPAPGGETRNYEASMTGDRGTAVAHSVTDTQSPPAANENAFVWYDKLKASENLQKNPGLTGDKKDDDKTENEAINNTSTAEANNATASNTSSGPEASTTATPENQAQVTTAKPTIEPTSTPSKSNTSEETSLDWFGATNPKPPIEGPQESLSVSPPAAQGKPQGWRIRDYYLDDNNSSNWEQLRSAWTNKNGSQFVFNNRISYNPNYNPKNEKVPEIHFLAGVTMPTLPTMLPPTDLPMNPFLNNNNDDDDEDQAEKTQKPTKMPTQEPGSYSLRYPWQWHNRRPIGNRYPDAKLHFHGRPTNVPTFRPLVVTTRVPSAKNSDTTTPKPTSLQMNPEYIEALRNKETNSNDSSVEVSKEKPPNKQDEDKKEGKSEDNNEKVQSADDNRNKENKEGNKWEKNIEQDNVLVESLKVSHINETEKKQEQSNTGIDVQSNQENQSNSNTTTWTKPPQELPILNEPTTKSVQSFLPGVRPPKDAKQNQEMSGKKLDELQTNKETNTGGPALSNNKEQVDQSGSLFNDKYLPDVQDLSSTTMYNTQQPRIPADVDAQQRASVTDSPLSRQAELVNQIRRVTLMNQNAAQRQLATNNASANSNAVASLYGTPLSSAVLNSSLGALINSYSYAAPVQVASNIINNDNSNKPSNSSVEVPNSQTNNFQNDLSSSPPIPPIFTPTISPKNVTKTNPQSPALPEMSVHQFPTPKPLFSFKSNFAGTAKANVLPFNTFTTPKITGSNPAQQTNNTNVAQSTSNNDQSTKAESPVNFRPALQYIADSVKQTPSENSVAVWKPASAGTVSSGLPETYQSMVNTTTTETNNKAQTSATTPANQQNPLTTAPLYSIAVKNANEVAKNESMSNSVNEQPLAQSNTVNRDFPVYDDKTHSYVYKNPANPTPANNAAPSSSISAWQGRIGSQSPTTSIRKEEKLSDSYLSLYGDQLNMDDLYWTDSNEEKENICKKEKGTNEVSHIMCFGDSLTRGYYNKGKSHHPYTNKLQFLLNKLDTKKCYIVENEGKDGELAFAEMPKRLESLFKEGTTKYDWTIILGGTNDIYNKKSKQRKSAEELTKNIISLHELAWSYGSKTVAVTIPEVFCETQDTCQDAKQLREKVNYDIRKYAYDHTGQTVLVDLADMLQRSHVEKDMVGQFFEGGLHLKPRGYEKMAIIIFEGMKRALS